MSKKISFSVNCEKSTDCSNDYECIQGICTKVKDFEPEYKKSPENKKKLWYDEDDFIKFREEDHIKRYVPWECQRCHVIEENNPTVCDLCAEDFVESRNPDYPFVELNEEQQQMNKQISSEEFLREIK